MLYNYNYVKIENSIIIHGRVEGGGGKGACLNRLRCSIVNSFFCYSAVTPCTKLEICNKYHIAPIYKRITNFQYTSI